MAAEATYFTRLYPKKLNIRNNVKSAMIQEFLFRLHASMDGGEDSISSVTSAPSFHMMPVPEPCNKLTAWSAQEEEVPCLNIDCEWISFMTTFYASASYDLFLLPGMGPRGHCVICQLAQRGKLDRSKLKLSSLRSVFIAEELTQYI